MGSKASLECHELGVSKNHGPNIPPTTPKTWTTSFWKQPASRLEVPMTAYTKGGRGRQTLCEVGPRLGDPSSL